MFAPESDIKFVKNTILEFLPSAEIFIFGSRATGISLKETSDLDVLIKNPNKLSFSEMAKIREKIEESNLKYRVDISDYHTISDEFRDKIIGDCVKL